MSANFNYYLSVTGDCSNTCSGAVRLTASGGTPPYYFDWGNCIYDDFRTGLCAGSYDVRVNDSTSPVNNEFTIMTFIFIMNNENPQYRKKKYKNYRS